MPDRDDEVLPPLLARATSLLRDEPPISPAWRAELLRKVRTPPRRVSLSFPVAIAAGLVCALIGGAVTYAAGHRDAMTTATLAATESPLGVNSDSGVRANGTVTLPVHFAVVAPSAVRVAIVGDFNHWNPTSLPMRRSADGRTWEVEVRLPLGRYSYAFLIDGKLAPDPAAPRSGGDDFGTPNSVVMVHGS